MPTFRAAPSTDNPLFDNCIIYDLILIINPVNDRTMEFSGLRRFAAAWENCLQKLLDAVSKANQSQGEYCQRRRGS